MSSERIILNVLCAAQRSLLGYVTPNLRAVFVRFIQEYEWELTFYYDLKPSEEEEELASEADTEFIAHFSFPEYTTHCSVKVLAYPQKIKQDGYCVYHRYEKSCNKLKIKDYFVQMISRVLPQFLLKK